MNRQKPTPIRRREVKSLGWKRELHTGFVVPRLNEPQIDTQAVGFIDFREYEWDGAAYGRKKRHE